MTGTIKSFAPSRGYGFIVAEGNEYWFHASEWAGNGKPQAGDEVNFIPATTQKGRRAFLITKEIKDGNTR